MLSVTDHIGSGDLTLSSFTPRALSHLILHIGADKNYIPVSTRKNNYLEAFCMSQDGEDRTPVHSDDQRPSRGLAGASSRAPPPTAVKLSRFASASWARRDVL